MQIVVNASNNGKSPSITTRSGSAGINDVVNQNSWYPKLSVIVFPNIKSHI